LAVINIDSPSALVRENDAERVRRRRRKPRPNSLTEVGEEEGGLFVRKTAASAARSDAANVAGRWRHWTIEKRATGPGTIGSCLA
jgi:hypothetical protein